MVQHQSGDAYVSAYFKGTVTHARLVGLKEIQLTTSFQGTHSKEMLILILTCKLCVFRVILPKGVGFLVGKRHP